MKKEINSGVILYLCLVLIIQGELSGNEWEVFMGEKRISLQLKVENPLNKEHA